MSQTSENDPTAAAGMSKRGFALSVLDDTACLLAGPAAENLEQASQRLERLLQAAEHSLSPEASGTAGTMVARQRLADAIKACRRGP